MSLDNDKIPEDLNEDDLGQLFHDDLLAVKQVVEQDDSRMIVSYMMYVGVQNTETGEITHVSSFATNEQDALIGRLELTKAIIIDRYNKSIDPMIKDHIQGESDQDKSDVQRLMSKVLRNKLN